MFATAVTEAFYNAIQDHQADQGWLEKKEEAYQRNKWFVTENIDQTLNQWMTALTPAAVETWLQPYGKISEDKGITIGIIMAGNIPLVGMHDLISCLVAGCNVVVKTASDDEVLPKFWIEKAAERMPALQSRIAFSDSMKNIDAAIATGSNNSSRYFEYYFKNKPHLLRKNRNSVSVLHGGETQEMLLGLGHDVFDYFGLGCRNVTHLMLPRDYFFKPLFDAWEYFDFLVNHNKYVNNYHYHKALLLMNLDPHLDNGFVLLKEKKEIYSPVGMLNYSFYSDLAEVKTFLDSNTEYIQCVTSDISEIGTLQFGEAQKTMMWDYADGKDTLQWLQSLDLGNRL